MFILNVTKNLPTNQITRVHKNVLFSISWKHLSVIKAKLPLPSVLHVDIQSCTLYTFQYFSMYRVYRSWSKTENGKLKTENWKQVGANGVFQWRVGNVISFLGRTMKQNVCFCPLETIQALGGAWRLEVGAWSLELGHPFRSRTRV